MFLEILGTYNPAKKAKEFDMEKAQAWIKKGAQVSDTVKKLFFTK